VLIVFNVSLVAVLWFGGHRIADDGAQVAAHAMAPGSALQVGAVLAFLSYLMQILIAVMLVTFISTMVPRAAVCAARISEVLSTESSVVSPAVPVVPSWWITMEAAALASSSDSRKLAPAASADARLAVTASLPLVLLNARDRTNLSRHVARGTNLQFGKPSRDIGCRRSLIAGNARKKAA